MAEDYNSLKQNACIQGVLDALKTAIPTEDQKVMLDGIGHLAEKEKMAGRAKDDNEALGLVLEKAIENGKQRKAIEVANKLRQAVILTKRVDLFKEFFTPEEAPDAVQAQLGGLISRRKGYRNKSTAHLQKIAEGEAIGKLLYNLKKDNVLQAFWLKQYENDIGSELFKENSTKNPIAQKIAQHVKGAYGEVSTRLRRAGIPVGTLEEFITSFHRNPQRMMSAFDSVKERWEYRAKNGFNLKKEREMAYQRWKSFELQQLDHNKTFVYGQTPQKIENFMRAAWRNQTIFDPIKRNASVEDLRTYGSLGVKGSAKRVFRYKNSAAFMSVMQKYGYGNLFDGIENTIGKGSKMAVMAEEWGTEPYRVFNAFIDRLKRYNAVKNDQKVINKLNAKYRLFDELTGRASIPVSQTMNNITNAYLGWQMISGLGSSIAPAFGDLNYYAASLVRNFDQGSFEAWGNTLRNYFRHMRKGATKENYEDMGYWQKTLLGQYSSRFGALDSPTQLISTLTQKMMTLNLIHWQDSMLSSGIINEFGRQMWRLGDTSFDRLPTGTRNVLNQYDLSPAEWDVMRKNPHTTPDGRKYITPDDAIDGYSREDIANMLGKKEKGMSTKEYDDARRGIREKYIGLLQDQSHFVFLDSDIVERSMLRMQTKSGTFMGSMAKLLVMFRSWPFAQTRRVLGMALEDFREAEGLVPKTKALMQGAPMFLQMLSGYMITGYISEAALNFAKGREPPSITSPVTWGKASLGTFGLLGGMLGQLLGQQMYGDSPITNLGGRGIDTANKVGILANAMFHGEGHAAGKLIYGLGESQIPYGNWIFTRAGLKWGLMYGLQEKLFPGSLDKMQDNAQEEGTPFIFSPTSALGGG